MADTALFVGWGAVKGGKEKTALGVFSEAVDFYTSCEQSGRLASFEAFILEVHGGDIAGFFLLRGDADKLHQLRYSDDFLRIINRANVVVHDLGVVTAFTGARMQQLMGNFQPNTEDLT